MTKYHIINRIVCRKNVPDAAGIAGQQLMSVIDAYDLPFTKATIGEATREERKSGLWQVEPGELGLHLYISCPACSRINDMTRHDVDIDGGVGTTCVVCDWCRNHFFPKLIGFTRELRNEIGKAKNAIIRKYGYI